MGTSGSSPRAGRPTRRRAIATILAVLACALWLATPGASLAEDDGLFETNDTRYVIAADGGPVKVTVDLTLRNTTPDVRTAGGIRYYYFTRYLVVVPTGAENLRATSNGRSLSVDLEKVPEAEGTDIQMAAISFPELRYGKTRAISLTYDLPGAAIRSSSLSRVGKGYAAFITSARGETGHTSVEVVAPKSYEFNASSDAFTETRSGATTTWKATQASDDLGIWEFVTLRDHSLAGESTITLGGDSVRLLSFPGDDAWSGFVADKLTAAVPHLERLTGTPWPGGLDTVVEDVSPTVTGYAWFDATTNEILLGEELDTHLLVHEASHVWFNHNRIGDRWLQEGLAEVVATRIGPLIGGEEEPPTAPDPNGKGAFKLTTWTQPGGRSAEADDYGYPAAYAAVDELIGHLDDEAFAGVVSAALDGESAYDLPGSTLNKAGTGTRRFLDLVEDRGGNTDAAGIYQTWILDEGASAVLDERSASRALYRDFDDSDGAWQPPKGLRWLMTDWQFPAADELMGDLEATAAAAGALQDEASAADLDLPASLREGYESADVPSGYQEAGKAIRAAADSVAGVDDATRAVAEADDPFSELGEAILGTDTRIDASRAAFSDGEFAVADRHARTAASQSRIAGWLGIATVAVGILTLAGVGVLGVALLRRGRSRSQPVATTPFVPGPPPGPLP